MYIYINLYEFEVRVVSDSRRPNSRRTKISPGNSEVEPIAIVYFLGESSLKTTKMHAEKMKTKYTLSYESSNGYTLHVSAYSNST